MAQTHDIDSQNATKLKNQIEFYFSDSNYPKDKFLREKAAENDGYIPITVLTTFPRVKNLSTDVDYIKAVLQTSGEVEVKDDMVKRKRPIPEKDTVNERSVYVKGLPDESKGVSIESLSEIFGKFGKVLSVRLRRGANKNFCHKAFIEFATEEEAKKCADEKEIPWLDVKIVLALKNEHFKKKREEMKKEKKEKQEGRTENTETAGAEGEQEEDIFKPALILEVANVPISTDRKELRAHFEKFGRVRYADFHNPGSGKAFIRFLEAESAKSGLAAVTDKTLTLGDAALAARILEGDEEKKYWDEKIKPFQAANRNGGRGGGRGWRGRGRGRGRGGKGSGRGTKRKGEGDGEAETDREIKKQKTE